MIFIFPIYGRERVYFNHFHVPSAITSTVKNVVKETNSQPMKIKRPIFGWEQFLLQISPLCEGYNLNTWTNVVKQAKSQLTTFAFPIFSSQATSTTLQIVKFADISMSHQKNVTVSKSITCQLDSCSICFAVTFSSAVTSKNSSETFQFHILRKLSTVHCDHERKCQLASRYRLDTEAKSSYFLFFLGGHCSGHVYRNSYMRAKFFNIFHVLINCYNRVQ